MYTFFVYTYNIPAFRRASTLLDRGPGGRVGKVGSLTGTGKHWLVHTISHSLATTDGLLIATITEQVIPT